MVARSAYIYTIYIQGIAILASRATGMIGAASWTAAMRRWYCGVRALAAEVHAAAVAIDRVTAVGGVAAPITPATLVAVLASRAVGVMRATVR